MPHYLYFRRHGQRWRLPDDAASPEFQRAYLELLARTDVEPPPRRIGDGSVAALIRDYRSSDEFLALKPKTQHDYLRMLDILTPIDHHPADAVRRRHVRELRKTLAGKGRSSAAFQPGGIVALQLWRRQRLLRKQSGRAYETARSGEGVQSMDRRGLRCFRKVATRSGKRSPPTCWGATQVSAAAMS